VWAYFGACLPLCLCFGVCKHLHLHLYLYVCVRKGMWVGGRGAQVDVYLSLSRMCVRLCQ